MRAAIALAESGAAVTVLTKDKASESNTEYAQGGVAVVMSTHVADLSRLRRTDSDIERIEGRIWAAGHSTSNVPPVRQ